MAENVPNQCCSLTLGEKCLFVLAAHEALAQEVKGVDVQSQDDISTIQTHIQAIRLKAGRVQIWVVWYSY